MTTAKLKKFKETNLRLYGVENPMMLKAFREKAKTTNLQLYGAANPSHVEEFNEKRRQTNLSRYGNIYPSHTEKARNTCIERYGVPHPMQDEKIFKRVMSARFRIKTYISPSGKVYYYQGYEDVAIRSIMHVVPESWIINGVTKVPKIMYYNTLLNKEARYYPDIWIKPLDLLVEVKSEFTFGINTSVTMEKREACKKAGYDHIILICAKKKLLRIV